MYVEEILSRLVGVKKRGALRWVAKCPAHQDKSPSLSIAELQDGRILLHDFGGCDTQAVLDALGLAVTDLFPAPLGVVMPSAQRMHAHTHAAADLLKIMAHEALVIAIAGDEIESGRTLEEADRVRVKEAVALLRSAATYL